MSAKDPRRAFLLYPDAGLRRALHRHKAARGSRSLADTARILLLRAPAPRPPIPPMHPAGRPLRLQLPKPVRTRITAQASELGCTPEALILHLLDRGTRA